MFIVAVPQLLLLNTFRCEDKGTKLRSVDYIVNIHVSVTLKGLSHQIRSA